MQSRVDHFHPRVAQRGGDDLGAAVVAIETGLGNEDSDGSGHEREAGNGKRETERSARTAARDTVTPVGERGRKLLAQRGAGNLPCDQQHLRAAPSERTVFPAVVGALHEEARRGAQLRGRRVAV